MTGNDYENLEAVEDTIERNEDRTYNGRPFYADPSSPVPEPEKPLALDFLGSADFPNYFNTYYYGRALQELEAAKESWRKTVNDLDQTPNQNFKPFTKFEYAEEKPRKPKRKHLQARISDLEIELTKLKDEIADQDIQMWAVSRQGGAYAARITAVKIKRSKLCITGTVNLFHAPVEIVAFRLLINDVTRSKDLTPSVTMMPSDSLEMTYDADFMLPAGT